jgi:2-polyprenyl-3-methyl-5-hydroxy-6-metoxy-1,4-benzoquinol methylase
LVPSGDSGSLAAAIERILTDKELAATLRRGATERATVFTEEAMAGKFNSLVRDVCPRSVTDRSELEERTVPGLHECVLNVVDGHDISGRRAVDLGTGSGALALKLSQRGFDLLACDVEKNRFKADLPFAVIDLDSSHFAETLGVGEYDLVTATEVIEHVEAPVSFLRNIAGLLAPKGVAIVTTPNVDSLPARVKFLFRGTLRLLDQYGDPTHISPIFVDLFIRQYLPRSGLILLDHSTFPADGFVVGRPIYRTFLRPLSFLLGRSRYLAGDNHIFVLGRADRAV